MWFIFHLIPSKGLFKYHIIISFGPLQTPPLPFLHHSPIRLAPPPHYLAWYFSLWPNLHSFFNLFSHFLVIFGRNCNNLELYHIRLTSLQHSHGFFTSRANPPLRPLGVWYDIRTAPNMMNEVKNKSNKIID